MKVEQLCAEAQRASRVLAGLSRARKDEALFAVADALRRRSAEILAENDEDVRLARENRLADALVDRLLLDEDRLRDVEAAVRDVAALPDPVGAAGRRLAPRQRRRAAQGPRAARRHRRHLRGAAQRHRRRRRAVPQVRQRRHPARRQRRAAHQPHPRRGRAGRGHRGRPAARGRLVPRARTAGSSPSCSSSASTSTSSSRAAARTSRSTCSRTARCRSSTPPAATATCTWTPPPTSTRRCRSSSTPSASARASATPPRRCSCTRTSPRRSCRAPRRSSSGAASSWSWTRRPGTPSATRPSSAPTRRTTTRSSWRSSWPCASSPRWTRPSSTSPPTAPGTPRPSSPRTSPPRGAFTAAGRRGLRLRQRVHAVHRRRPVRPGRRDGHLHAEAARPRPHRAAGAHVRQVRAVGRRAGAGLAAWPTRSRAWASWAGASTRRTSRHLAIASEACHALGLERVLFVPAAAPPHKGGERAHPGEVRLEMTSLAIDDDLRFTASGIEIERGLVYTVDTLRALNERYAGHELVFIMGSDSLLQLETWHEPEELLSRCSLAVAPRPGDSPEAIAAAAARWGDYQVTVLDVPRSPSPRRTIRARVAAAPADPLSGAAPRGAVHPGDGAVPVTGIDRAEAEALIAERLSAAPPRPRPSGGRGGRDPGAPVRRLRRTRPSSRACCTTYCRELPDDETLAAAAPLRHPRGPGRGAAPQEDPARSGGRRRARRARAWTRRSCGRSRLHTVGDAGHDRAREVRVPRRLLRALPPASPASTTCAPWRRRRWTRPSAPRRA